MANFGKFANLSPTGWKRRDRNPGDLNRSQRSHRFMGRWTGRRRFNCETRGPQDLRRARRAASRRLGSLEAFFAYCPPGRETEGQCLHALGRNLR
jgi:hypothetical protein